MTVPPWSFTADYGEGCNCDCGCPCNLNGSLPPAPARRWILAVRTGRSGEVPLDGMDVVTVMAWPGAIHEGNGTVRLTVDEGADARQREAVRQIFSGRAGGSGPLALWAGPSKYVLPPLTPSDFSRSGKGGHGGERALWWPAARVRSGSRKEGDHG